MIKVKFHEKLLYRKKKKKQNNIPQKKDKFAKQDETKISIWKWAKRYQENVTILIRKSQIWLQMFRNELRK